MVMTTTYDYMAMMTTVTVVSGDDVMASTNFVAAAATPK